MTFTYSPTRMTVTPLGPDGKPAGEPVELGVRSFTLNINPRPKENTMPVLPDIPTGMTKPKMWERYQQLLADRDQLQADHDELAGQLSDIDPEARAMGTCVNALDAMLTGIASRQQRDRDGYAMSATTEWVQPHRPTALDSSVGRILLHLAARYGVDLVAMPPEPPPEPNVEGSELVIAPAKLARRIEQLLRDNPWALEDLR